VDYPELCGMLHKLLTPISPRWDITLLHFRKTGQRSATALLGLRVPQGEMGALQEAVAALNDEFQFRELSGRDLEIFKLFV
jgi:threonine dehydratase